VRMVKWMKREVNLPGAPIFCLKVMCFLTKRGPDESGKGQLELGVVRVVLASVGHIPKWMVQSRSNNWQQHLLLSPAK